uniref:5' UTR upstream of amiE gene and upstream ORF n=1 Tax=Pseudomonas aeruginosa TaxID=287 RepID=Q51501_PSEAI|nr:ORF downstream of amiE gene [Pseudomonas aeruginosa]
MRISVDVAGPNLTHTHRANGLSRGYPGGPFFVPKK